ncbi:MAG: TrbI/VirB10 family protein, partial [Proteobacteria bacterium]|nr:TrbI/VirB10 family protein [Pseudomonadota bacterium]
AIFLYFFVFSSSDEEDVDVAKKKQAIDKNKTSILENSVKITKPADIEISLPQTITLPSPPVLKDPEPEIEIKAEKAVEMPSQLPSLISNEKESQNQKTPQILKTDNTIPQPSYIMPISPFGANKQEEEEKKKQQALNNRRRASIMVMGGKGGDLFNQNNPSKDTNESASKVKSRNKSEYLGFGEGKLDGNTMQRTNAPNVTATKIGDLKRMILQGKVLDAVLETAINTDLPGSLRAIVTRDVYSEAGSSVLIPKGSRLIGNYDANISAGQTRVSIIWNRLILTNGTDINIASSGTDRLGRAGVAGKVDNKIFERLASAALVSYVIPLAINKVTGIGDDVVGSETKPDGSTSDTGTVNSVTMREAGEDFSNIAKDVVNSSFSSSPSITINQGTIITILVQNDLTFPVNRYGF